MTKCRTARRPWPATLRSGIAIGRHWRRKRAVVANDGFSTTPAALRICAATGVKPVPSRGMTASKAIAS